MAAAGSSAVDIEGIEIALLTQAMFSRYGYDFRNYAPSSLRRRVQKALRTENLTSISLLQDRVLRDPRCMSRLLSTLTVQVTSMFRHPSFYACFREKAVPLLRTYSGLRIWHADCATGEEVYSLAIVLEEEGLLERSRIYATDVSDVALDKAQSGLVPLSTMKDYTARYHATGGRQDFSSYYRVVGEHAVLSPHLRQNVVFAVHNLATDASFNEFQVIFCRNVMIYFDAVLQARVRKLLHESLCPLGFLGLGEKESLRPSELANGYEEVVRGERLLRRLH